MPAEDSDQPELIRKIESLKGLASSVKTTFKRAEQRKTEIVGEAVERGDAALTQAYWTARRFQVGSRKRLAIEKLAQIELMLTKLKADYAEMPEHKNQAVVGAMERGASVLGHAFEALLRAEDDEALRLGNVAFLHVNLGRQLIDADTIEYLLGESEYLQLDGSLPSAEVQVERQFSALEQEILKLRSLIKQKS